MTTLLLALAIGLANAARGSGIKGGKVIVVLMMLLASYAMTWDVVRTIIFPLPLCAFWWQKGGTGIRMKETIAKLSFLHLGNNTWRFFEFFSVFVYSLGYLSI
jgi:hypothetical protein